MRYRLMASYLGASYQAAVGPSDRDVTLFAAPPPPEEHGFSPVPGGVWRKQVRLDDLDGLWESRPIGSYHGEPCLVLDDLGDRLHIVYLGMDERRAGQLGYWQVDRGVFEVVVQRHEVTDLAEERHEFPIALLLSALPRALTATRARATAPVPGLAPVRGPGRAPGRERRDRDRPDRPAQRRPGRERGRRRDLDLERSAGHRDSPVARGPAAASRAHRRACSSRRRAAAAAGRAGVDAAVGPAAVNAAVDAAARGRGRAAGDDRRLSVAAGNGERATARPAPSPAHRWRRAPAGAGGPAAGNRRDVRPVVGRLPGRRPRPSSWAGFESPAGAAGAAYAAGLRRAAGDRRAAVPGYPDLRRPAGAGYPADRRGRAGGRAAASERAAARRRGRLAWLAGA